MWIVSKCLNGDHNVLFQGLFHQKSTFYVHWPNQNLFGKCLVLDNLWSTSILSLLPRLPFFFSLIVGRGNWGRGGHMFVLEMLFSCSWTSDKRRSYWYPRPLLTWCLTSCKLPCCTIGSLWLISQNCITLSLTAIFGEGLGAGGCDTQGVQWEEQELSSYQLSCGLCLNLELATVHSALCMHLVTS